MMNDFIGKTIAGYNVENKIGQGSLATVFRATKTGDAAAVKIVPLAGLDVSVAFAELFGQRMEAIAGLNHPRILKLRAFGVENDYAYLVTQLIGSGDTLANKLRSAPLSRWKALEAIRQIAGALEHAHNSNVLHLDLKPSNVLLNEKNWPWVADFGLEAVLHEAGLVAPASVYQAPEQVLGQAVDQRTDIFAVGMLLYEMLTGTLPSAAGQSEAGQVASPRAINPNITESISHVTLRALAIEPTDRYASVFDFVQALKVATSDDSYREPYVDRLPALPPPPPVVAVTEVAPQPESTESIESIGPEPADTQPVKASPGVLIPLPTSATGTSKPASSSVSPTDDPEPAEEDHSAAAMAAAGTVAAATAAAIAAAAAHSKAAAENIEPGDEPATATTDEPSTDAPDDEPDLGSPEGDESAEITPVNEPLPPPPVVPVPVAGPPLQTPPQPIEPPLPRPQPEVITTPPPKVVPITKIPPDRPEVAAATATAASQPAGAKAKQPRSGGPADWKLPTWVTVLGILLVAVIVVWVIFAMSVSDTESRLDATQTAAAAIAAEPTATATAALPTDTPPPAPTNTLVALPTDTPLPSTHTPEVVPTDTPLPPPPTETPEPLPSPSPTPTETPEPTPTVPAGEWVLLSPAVGDAPTIGPVPFDFQWQWSEELLPGQGFEVRVWREGQAPQGVHDAVADNQAGLIKQLDDTTYSFELDISNAANVDGVSSPYAWAVALVQVEPEYADLGQQSETGILQYVGYRGPEDVGVQAEPPPPSEEAPVEVRPLLRVMRIAPPPPMKLHPTKTAVIIQPVPQHRVCGQLV